MDAQQEIEKILARFNIAQLKNLLTHFPPESEEALRGFVLETTRGSTTTRQALYRVLVPEKQITDEQFAECTDSGQAVTQNGSLNGHTSNMTKAVFERDEDFGLSSSEEAELLNLSQSYDGGQHSPVKKRKSQDELGNELKRPKTEPASRELNVALSMLNEHFKMDGFRFKQEQAINRLLSGNSAVVVFPTGGGKSLVYQLPAICFKEIDKLAGVRQGLAEGGITLVVSPLIALMKDQVDALKRRGIKAAVLDSTKTQEEYRATVDSLRAGTLDILYCAPERLNNEGFVGSMAHVRGGVRLLAVDEAHCISEWGHAFRPDYLKVARFVKEIQAERVVCLTATATPPVAKDICKAFDIPDDGLFRTSSYRPNLSLRAAAYQTKKESFPKLRAFLTAHPGPTIIYVTLQKQAEELAENLRSHRFSACHFHAGMNKDDKAKCQDTFMASKNLIVVATIAFGMGIDKADIRNVIHYDIPRSLEGYSQEIGRAGRDGLQSQCMLYLCAEDLHLRESFARGDLPGKESVVALINEVFDAQPTDGPLPSIEVNHYNQSKEHDIRPTVLNNIYAQLELRFNLLRASTPKYTSYSYTTLGKLMGDKTPASNAILQSAVTKKTLTHIDVDSAAQRSGLLRADIVTKLNEWHDQKKIDLRTAGVVHIYRILNNLPKAAKDRQDIIDKLYRELELREQQDIQRMQQVNDLITGEACFSRALAQYFGDSLPDDAQSCGHCTWCETKTPVENMTPPKRAWDSKAFYAVLQACPERDDPRYLARVAFGISSPRVTQAKLGKSPVFGSMEDHNFMTLLSAFRKVCDQTGAAPRKFKDSK